MEPVILGISGDNKTGKTTLALTMPKPLLHLELDIGGFARAAHRFKQEVDQGLITNIKYHIPQQAVLDKLKGGVRLRKPNKVIGMTEIWYRFLEDYAEALEDPNIKTIVMDSFPEVWDYCVRSYLQELQEGDPNKNRVQLLQIEYGEPNARMKALLVAAKEMGKNLVLIHYLVPNYTKKLIDGAIKEYEDGMTRAGWRYVEKFVDLMVETSIEKNKDGYVPVGRVTLCGLALELTDMKFSEPSWKDIEATIKVYRGG